MSTYKMNWRGAAASKAVGQALLDGGEEWMRAKVLPDADEHCPVDTGVMKSTHTVARDEKSVAIGYGGPSAPYTVKQHEDLTLHHVVGEAKWLENAWNRHAAELKPILKKRIGAIRI
jgi:hypothetical protein